MDWYHSIRKELWHSCDRSICIRLNVRLQKAKEEVTDEFGRIQTLLNYSGGKQWVTEAGFPSGVTLTENCSLTTEKIEGMR